MRGAVPGGGGRERDRSREGSERGGRRRELKRAVEGSEQDGHTEQTGAKPPPPPFSPPIHAPDSCHPDERLAECRKKYLSARVVHPALQVLLQQLAPEPLVPGVALHQEAVPQLRSGQTMRKGGLKHVLRWMRQVGDAG